MYLEGTRGLYVNVGIGYVGLPFRFGAWPESLCLPYDGKHALSIDFLMHLHLDGDPFTHFLYMRNYSIFLPCICNCSNASIAVRKLSASKEPNPSSIKKRFYFQVVARQRGQSQCQCQRYQKRLSSRKRIYSPYFITHITINHLKRQSAGYLLQFIAFG